MNSVKNFTIFSPHMHKSSHRRCFVQKVILKNVAKFTGKHLCWSLFLVISCEFLRTPLGDCMKWSPGDPQKEILNSLDKTNLLLTEIKLVHY